MIKSGDAFALSGIAYFFSAVGCAISAFYRKTDNILWPLSGLIFSVGTLNLCCEERLAVSRLPFMGVALTLIAVFLLVYRWLCLRLIQRTGLRAGFASETYSFLPIFYVGLISVAVALLTQPSEKFENPPLVLYTFILLVSAIHLPTFILGKSRIDKYLADSGIALSNRYSDFSWEFFKIVIAVLGIPLVVSLIAQGVLLGDYRLPVVNAAMTAEIFSLLWIFRRGSSLELSPSVKET